MKKLFLFLSFCSLQLLSAQNTRVLFIGNSYTAANNLPQTVRDLALSLGDSISFDSNTPGGFTFQGHSNDATTLSKISAGNWDYVVLQAQSQEPSFSPAQVQAQTYPYARKLDSLIHAHTECAITMFYMTWGRKYGDASNCAVYPPVCTYDGMSQRLRESYLEMGEDNHSQVAPVGVAWKNARLADSTINLWSGDNSHPSVAGTYLTACVFYASIFKQSPVGATYTGGLSGSDAAFLQNIAAATVLDSLDTWLLNNAPIEADFTSAGAQGAFSFTNTSYNASSFQWDFGDGNTSALESPQHTYTANGTYNVQLIASNACYSDTVTMAVTVTGATGLVETDAVSWNIFPNPATNYLILQPHGVTGYEVALMDMTGRVLIRLSNPTSMDISMLAPGTYMLSITGGNTTSCRSIVVQ